MQKSRTLKKRLFITTVILAMMGSMTGCIFPVWERIVRWPGARVRREVPLCHIGPIKFRWVELQPGKDTTEFSIQMPDGRILTSDQLTVEAFSQYLTPCAPETQKWYPAVSDCAFLENDNGYVKVRFEGNGKAAYVLLCAYFYSQPPRPGQWVPAIGNRDGSQVFPLPITEDELIKLFGEPIGAWTSLFST